MMCRGSHATRRARDMSNSWMFGIGVFAMTALAQAISRLSGFDVDVASLKAVLAFCGVGLLISLVFILSGLDPFPF